jgi:uncharacterized protein (UPF0332 family)
MHNRYSREHFAAKLNANGDPKLNAAADFTARLLNGPIGDKIARIILFGSVAGGVAGPNSDVDILVFGFAHPKVLRRFAAEAAWDTSVEWAEQVAQITYGVSDLLQPRSYLIYNALKRGREIYTMDESQVRRLGAEAIYRKAERHLTQAEAAFADELFELSIVGAYTAAELVAKALILIKSEGELPYTHGGLINRFGELYAKTGEVPRQWGRLLNEKLDVRSRSLYDERVTMGPDDAQSVLDLARNMLDFLKRKLGESEGGESQ